MASNTLFELWEDVGADWSETKIYDLVLFRYSIEFYDASISTADCMYVISCALSRVR